MNRLTPQTELLHTSKNEVKVLSLTTMALTYAVGPNGHPYGICSAYGIRSANGWTDDKPYNLIA